MNYELMKRLQYLIIFIMTALLLPMNIQAQDSGASRDIYTQAENDYKIGRFDSALDLLETNINDFQGNLTSLSVSWLRITGNGQNITQTCC